MIAIIGDLHGDYNRLQQILDALPDSVTCAIQVGDFGFYNYLRPNWNALHPKIPVYWIDGNHEGFAELRVNIDEPHQLKTDITEFSPNIFYVPRGTVLELDGRKIAMLGGAASVDKAWRKQEVDWFSDENITFDQHTSLYAVDSVDLFITHCPPQSIIDRHFNPHDLAMFGLPPTWRDPNAAIVEKLWVHLQKPMLYCGHMHRKVVDNNCRILDIGEYVIV